MDSIPGHSVISLIKQMVMQMSALRAIINNSFWKSFDTTFIGKKKKKNCQNINFFFL